MAKSDFDPERIESLAKELQICAELLPLRKEVCETLRDSAEVLCIMKIALMDECFSEELFISAMTNGQRELEARQRRALLRVVR